MISRTERTKNCHTLLPSPTLAFPFCPHYTKKVRFTLAGMFQIVIPHQMHGGYEVPLRVLRELTLDMVRGMIPVFIDRDIQYFISPKAKVPKMAISDDGSGWQDVLFHIPDCDYHDISEFNDPAIVDIEDYLDVWDYPLIDQGARWKRYLLAAAHQEIIHVRRYTAQVFCIFGETTWVIHFEAIHYLQGMLVALLCCPYSSMSISAIYDHYVPQEIGFSKGEDSSISILRMLLSHLPQSVGQEVYGFLTTPCSANLWETSHSFCRNRTLNDTGICEPCAAVSTDLNLFRVSLRPRTCARSRGTRAKTNM